MPSKREPMAQVFDRLLREGYHAPEIVRAAVRLQREKTATTFENLLALCRQLRAEQERAA